MKTLQYGAFVGIFFKFNNWCSDMSTFKFVIHSFHNKNYVNNNNSNNNNNYSNILLFSANLMEKFDFYLLVLCWEF